MFLGNRQHSRDKTMYWLSNTVIGIQTIYVHTQKKKNGLSRLYTHTHTHVYVTVIVMKIDLQFEQA